MGDVCLEPKRAKVYQTYRLLLHNHQVTFLHPFLLLHNHQLTSSSVTLLNKLQVELFKLIWAVIKIDKLYAQNYPTLTEQSVSLQQSDWSMPGAATMCYHCHWLLLLFAV
jgi:hypothetical protein